MQIMEWMGDNGYIDIDQAGMVKYFEAKMDVKVGSEDKLPFPEFLRSEECAAILRRTLFLRCGRSAPRSRPRVKGTGKPSAGKGTKFAREVPRDSGNMVKNGFAA